MKKIQAYFRTENDAESMRIRLQAYNVNKIEVGETGTIIGDTLLGSYGLGLDDDRVVKDRPDRHDDPGSQPVTPPIGLGAFGKIGEEPYTRERAQINELTEAQELSPDEYRNLPYVLSADVADSACQEVVGLIQSNDGYVEVLE